MFWANAKRLARLTVAADRFAVQAEGGAAKRAELDCPGTGLPLARQMRAEAEFMPG